jgi:hypothetical protein
MTGPASRVPWKPGEPVIMEQDYLEWQACHRERALELQQ